jgi:arylsulfatase
LYAHEGRLKYCYNLLGVQRFHVDTNGGSPIAAGQHQVRMEFAYDGGGLAKGGTVSLYVDGDKAGEGRVDATVAMIFSADDTLDVGEEGGALVTEDYGRDNAFSGRVNWVQIDLSTDDADHMISDEERVRVAMARQ